MKDKSEVKPNFAPIYACMYPELAKIFIEHGYALAVHGSLVNDFDLIAVPWAKEVSEPLTVISEITKRFAIEPVFEYPFKREHGRVAYQISLTFGKAYIDLSFFPGLTGKV